MSYCLSRTYLFATNRMFSLSSCNAFFPYLRSPSHKQGPLSLYVKQIHLTCPLHGPPTLVDKTHFGLVLYDLAYFYWFEEKSCYWSVKLISVFLCFSLVNKRHTSCITVYNLTVTNIKNTVRAMHSCNSWIAEDGQSSLFSSL